MGFLNRAALMLARVCVRVCVCVCDTEFEVFIRYSRDAKQAIGYYCWDLGGVAGWRYKAGDQ